MNRVLILDNECQWQKEFKLFLPFNYFIQSCVFKHQAEKALKDEIFHVFVISVGSGENLTFLESLKKCYNHIPVLLIYEDLGILSKTNLFKNEVYSILRKPVNFKELKNQIDTIITWTSLSRKNEISAGSNLMIGESRQIIEIQNRISDFAQSDKPILLLGETGTGKDLIAKLIHWASPMKGGPFLAKNCAAIPEKLMESELFGSVKGAFTEAVDKPGIFEQARDGTLFLDEIGEMSLESQAKFLRVLDEKEIIRLGCSKRISCNARIITATNRNLRNLIQIGKFREDLYYRIFVLVIQIPPLRERLEDIPLLAEHFINKYASTGKHISLPALDKLLNHCWPGNIRELQNVIQRAVVLSKEKEITEEYIEFAA